MYDFNLLYEFNHPKGTPLNYSKYEEYHFETKNPGQWAFKFPNNYGASVIKHPGSYGYYEDKFELAVLKFETEEVSEYHLCYDTPITDDVIGYLTEEEVFDRLEEIKQL